MKLERENGARKITGLKKIQSAVSGSDAFLFSISMTKLVVITQMCLGNQGSCNVISNIWQPLESVSI